MDGVTTGAGLGALGFWVFIATIVAVGVWDNIRKRDAQHETLRRVIESGQPIDEELTDKLLSITGNSADLERDLYVAASIMMGLAPGLAVFGWLMSIAVAEVLMGIMLAVSALVLCLGLGFYASARVIRRWDQNRDSSVSP